MEKRLERAPVAGITKPDPYDPFVNSPRLMPIIAFLDEHELLDDPAAIPEDECDTRNLVVEARQLTDLLNESGARYVTWPQVASYCNTYSCLDQQLTDQLGKTDALAWLVLACCSEHRITVARHPERAAWRSFRDLGLPQDYDLDALNEELLVDQIVDEQRRAADRPAVPTPDGHSPPAGSGQAVARVPDDISDSDELNDAAEEHSSKTPEQRIERATADQLIDVDQLAVLGSLISAGGRLRRGELRRASGLDKSAARAAVGSLEELGIVEHAGKRSVQVVDGFSGLLINTPNEDRS